ncbi:MAG: hypothetical protein ABI321_12015 [Polyangia bacterium]
MSVRVVLALLLVSGTASAERVVVLPVIASAKDPITLKLASTVEGALVEATHAIAGMKVLNETNGVLRDGKADSHPRGATLAHDLSAEVVIIAETQPVADGAVVYLTMVEPDGRVRGTTSVVVTKPDELSRLLRGGIVQVLDPAHYTGRLELKVDVKGAQAEVDGRPLALGTTDLSVGTHAVRVTHPAYHDWVRFVDIGFDRTRTETVALAMFPLTEGEMADRRRHGAPVAVGPVPWYRSWWALTVGGVVLAGVTTGIVLGVRPGLAHDHDVSYRATPAP